MKNLYGKRVLCLLCVGALLVSGCSVPSLQDLKDSVQSAKDLVNGSGSNESFWGSSFSTNLFGTAEETEEPDDTQKEDVFDPEVLAAVTARAETNYYYGLLSDVEKTNYVHVAAALEEQRESVKLTFTNAETASQTYSCVLMDYPEYFWVDASYKYYESPIRQEVEILPQYNCGVDERSERQAVITAVASQVIAQAPMTEDRYEEIKYVYEYIINNTDYQLDAPESQNIFSVFNNRSSVCAGYAKAMQYLLNQMGIFCIYVSGRTDTGELHAWNIVQCGGAYCYVDVTWGDPVYLETMQEGAPNQDNISYDYLCCSETMMQRTHTPDATFALPACTTDVYEYYRRLGRFFDVVDENQLLGMMENDILAGAPRSDMQFSSAEAYQAAVASCEGSLFEQAAQFLGSQYGLSSISYYHQNVDDTWRISVWWQYS